MAKEIMGFLPGATVSIAGTKEGTTIPAEVPSWLGSAAPEPDPEAPPPPAVSGDLTETDWLLEAMATPLGDKTIIDLRRVPEPPANHIFLHFQAEVAGAVTMLQHGGGLNVRHVIAGTASASSSVRVRPVFVAVTKNSESLYIYGAEATGAWSPPKTATTISGVVTCVEITRSRDAGFAPVNVA